MTQGAEKRFRELLRGQWIYLVHVLALVAPGRRVPVYSVAPGPTDPLVEWSVEDCALMIDEGRLQVQRQQEHDERLRGRAQWLFTVGVAAFAGLVSKYASDDLSTVGEALWLLGAALLTYGIGGGTAILAVRADFEMIHTAVLSTREPPIVRRLAESYSRMTTTGENTLATRLTVFRQATVYCLVGGYVGLVAILL